MKLVDESGWRGARLPELRGEIYARLREKLGTISSEGDSVIGQIIGINAEDDLQVVESLGWLYMGFFISQGEGPQLDGKGEILGVRRRGLTHSSVVVVYLLEGGSSVDAGDTFTVSGINGEWGVSAPIAADKKRAVGVILEINDAALITGNVFVISVNAVDYTTSYETGDTSTSVMSRLFGIAAEANTSLSTMSTEFGLMLYVDDGETLATFAYSDEVFSVIRVAMPVMAFYQSDEEFPLVEYGDIVTNEILVLSPGIRGFEIELDEVYRPRLQAAANKRSIGVAASRPGIRAAVAAVSGVTYCSVNSNRTIETNSDGLPGKSVRVFVSGGNDDDIAQAIWDSASGEVNTYGANYGTASDGEVTETMYFDRQAYQLVYVSVSGAVWDVEIGTQPDDYFTVVRTVIEDYFSALPVSRDVFAGQIYARLLIALPPLTDIVIYVGVNSPPTERAVSISDGVVGVTKDSAITIEGES
ncbi:TPA: baseplate protein [Yersinia enterocolitica]|nr:baseplate protein [Yersinia enterocolitica]